MLIESNSVRELLNANASEVAHTEDLEADEQEEKGEKTFTHGQPSVPLNPIPALVIMLLGIMMTSHTQESKISTMVHRQWGNLLMGGSSARALTCVLMYLKPPRSILPSRPPTELLAAFGLISGGTILMASVSPPVGFLFRSQETDTYLFLQAADTVSGMERYGLDVMFFYTVTMGFVTLLMAWILALLALKGWAIRKEASMRTYG